MIHPITMAFTVQVVPVGVRTAPDSGATCPDCPSCPGKFTGTAKCDIYIVKSLPKGKFRNSGGRTNYEV